MKRRFLSHGDIIKSFMTLRQRAIALYGNITEADFREIIPESKWTICQHLEHLLKFGEYHITALDKALVKIVDNRAFSSLTFTPTPEEEILISRVAKPESRLTDQTGLFNPGSYSSRGTLFNKFVSMQDLFISQLNLADGYSLDKYEVNVTLDHGYSLRPGAAFLVLAAYEDRHLGILEKLGLSGLNKSKNQGEKFHAY